MFNGLLCAVRQTPEEQMVDTDLRTLTEDHVANLNSEPGPDTATMRRFGTDSLLRLLARLHLREPAK